MPRRRTLVLAVAGMLALSACSATVESGDTTAPTVPSQTGADGGSGLGSEPGAGDHPSVVPPPDGDEADATVPPGDEAVPDGDEAVPPGDEVVDDDPPWYDDVYDPECVVEVRPGESLSLIADRFDDDTVHATSIAAENDVSGDTIFPGHLLDVCVDNGLDDITGEQRLERNAAIVATETQEAVVAQQEHLNTLFDGYGIAPLVVDGVSGPVTRQRLCAARLALGLDVSREDMAPGSEEEELLLSSTELPVPFTSAILSERWILIDQTCQIMFVGESDERIVHVFPTSTGEEGHRTRPQDQSRVVRYNPATDNNGWHNSTTFPAEEDNPLNGNMYKPLYFDRGQAIHGANNVPTSPQSKGCARLRVEHQDMLVAWLGLQDVDRITTDSGRINVTVNVQGSYEEM